MQFLLLSFMILSSMAIELCAGHQMSKHRKKIQDNNDAPISLHKENDVLIALQSAFDQLNPNLQSFIKSYITWTDDEQKKIRASINPVFSLIIDRLDDSMDSLKKDALYLLMNVNIPEQEEKHLYDAILLIRNNHLPKTLDLTIKNIQQLKTTTGSRVFLKKYKRHYEENE